MTLVSVSPGPHPDELRHAVGGIARAATAPEFAGHSGALCMRGKQLSLKGAANDPSLATRVWSISEQQTGVEPARSAVSAAGGLHARSSRHTSRGQTVPPREARATRPKPRPREALALPGETRPHIRRLRNQIAPKVPCHLPPKITNDSGDPVIRGLH